MGFVGLWAKQGYMTPPSQDVLSMYSNSLGPTPASFYPSFCHVDRLQVSGTPAIAMGTLQICSLRLPGVLWIPCLCPETSHPKAWILTFRFPN